MQQPLVGVRTATPHCNYLTACPSTHTHAHTYIHVHIMEQRAWPRWHKVAQQHRAHCWAACRCLLCRTTTDGSKWNNQTKQKESRSASLRIDDLLEEQLFNRMKLSNKKWKTQIKVVRGDITEEMLGLSEEDQKDIFANVSVIHHLVTTWPHPCVLLARAPRCGACAYAP